MDCSNEVYFYTNTDNIAAFGNTGSRIKIHLFSRFYSKTYMIDQNLGFSYIYGAHYLNVDTTSEKGIQRAHAMGFHTRKSLVQFVLSPLLKPATEFLFSDENKGSIFTFLRHPVERAASLFYYLQNATWGKYIN
jgi:hypothetical protein